MSTHYGLVRFTLHAIRQAHAWVDLRDEYDRLEPGADMAARTDLERRMHIACRRGTWAMITAQPLG